MSKEFNKMYVQPTYSDAEYEVYEITQIWSEWGEGEEESVLFTGSLSDCEAYIRLRESGRLQ